jgi:DNA-binding response OmpR family regulator
VSEAATVADARNALGLSAETSDPLPLPAWILLDLMLPDGCGTDILRQVRACGLPCQVCIITGAGPEMLAEAVRAGADLAFTKPVDVEDLISKLDAHPCMSQ